VLGWPTPACGGGVLRKTGTIWTGKIEVSVLGLPTPACGGGVMCRTGTIWVLHKTGTIVAREDGVAVPKDAMTESRLIFAKDSGYW